MEAQAVIDNDVKIEGVTSPFVFIVIERLDFDCIIGMDLLNETKAVIDIHSSLLTLFEGLTAINMTLTGQHITVSSIATVEIPPFSEAVVAVRPDRKAQKRDYIIEGCAKAPCTALMVARAIADGKRDKLSCRVLNPTEKPIKLKSGTTIGILARVAVHSMVATMKTQHKQRATITQMLKALANKKMSLEGVAVTGVDFDNLVTLLYENLDLFATSLADMCGTNLMMHKIDTGNSTPIRKQSYRQAQIAKQTNAMLRAGITEITDSPWSSPVLLVSKKDGSKRCCVNYRALNEITELTSWSIPLLEEVLDTVSE